MTPNELRYVQKLERRIHNQRSELRRARSSGDRQIDWLKLRKAYWDALKQQRERLQEGR